MNTFLNPTPPDCCSMFEIVNRAKHKWSGDYLSHLRGMFIFEELTAFQVSAEGEVTLIQSSFWKDIELSRKAIEANEIWSISPRAMIGRPVVNRVNVTDKLPYLWEIKQKLNVTGSNNLNLLNVEPSNNVHISAKKKGGRPTNTSHDNFWIEASRLVYVADQGGRGQTQKAFIDAMCDWAQANMAEPYGEDTIEAKVKKLWRALELGSKKG